MYLLSMDLDYDVCFGGVLLSLLFNTIEYPQVSVQYSKLFNVGFRIFEYCMYSIQYFNIKITFMWYSKSSYDNDLKKTLKPKN